MDNIVGGIRSRFFGTMSENATDEEGNAQKRQQKTSSRRSIHFEDKGSRWRSSARRRTNTGIGKKRRSLMPPRSQSYSSDDSSDIEAVVAAAALAVSTHADGSSSSNSSRERSPVSSHAQNSWSPMTGIGEDVNSRALVPSSSMERKSKDNWALVPVPSRKASKRETESASGRWYKQIVPSRSGRSDSREGSGRMSRISSKAKDNRKHTDIIYEQSKRGEKEAKAAAWLEAEIAKIEHRFGMKANAIQAWENERINKEDMNFKEIERKLNEQRMKAFEKMQSEIDKVNKKSRER